MTNLTLPPGLLDRKNVIAWPVLQRTIEASVPSPSAPVSYWQRLANQLRQPIGLGREALPPGVYILVYHSVVDPENRREWERYYRKGEVSVSRFASQLDAMLEWMTPIALSELPTLWQRGGPEQPRFAVTFDDGLRNNLHLAHPVLKARGIRPTVFVNAAFAEGREVLFRVLAAVLTGSGCAAPLAAALRSSLPQIPWSEDPTQLFNQTKGFYHVHLMERIVHQIYRELRGDPAELRVHLNVAEIMHLQREGWEIANHTADHRILSCLNRAEVTQTVVSNAAFWQNQGIDLIPCLGYPFGLAADVNRAVYDHLLENPTLHGFFAGGGVNLIDNRTEWLRFSLGQAATQQGVMAVLKGEVVRTRSAFAHILSVQ
ncbi:MAG: polysaccharide deacetylase family protein [Magnetococcales bacterium]|nr:polysaccharide deacetylase family protein [Magnetococcales bacterium]